MEGIVVIWCPGLPSHRLQEALKAMVLPSLISFITCSLNTVNVDNWKTLEPYFALAWQRLLLGASLFPTCAVHIQYVSILIYLIFLFSLFQLNMTISRTFWMKFLSVILIVLLLLEAIETRVSTKIFVVLYHVSACGPFELIRGKFISFLDRNIIFLIVLVRW